MEIIPSIFDEGYSIISELGRGSTGVVYKIQAKQTGRIYALKKISVQKMSVPQRTKKLSEIQSLQSLLHPNIIQNIESKIIENNLFIVMEYAENGDLSQVISIQKDKKKRFLSEPYIWDVFWQVCLGVLHLHSHNIMHRDIKSLNILLSNKGDQYSQIKLGDLADTKPYLNSDMNLKLAGTPLYLAPELVRGEAYDNKVDIWALGCVLYELITLNPAFSGSTPEELFEKIENKQPKIITLPYSKKLIELCMKLLNKKKELRPHIDEIIDSFPQQYRVFFYL